MGTVDGSENLVTEADIDGESRHGILWWGDRYQHQISRAGVIIALMTTAIGITLVVRADSSPPVGKNDAQAYSGRPTVQTVDCGAVSSDSGVVTRSATSDAPGEISVPGDGADSTDAAADPGAVPAVDATDPGTGPAPTTESTSAAPESTTATTTDAPPTSTAASAGASFSATASLSIQIMPSMRTRARSSHHRCRPRLRLRWRDRR